MAKYLYCNVGILSMISIAKYFFMQVSKYTYS